MRIQVTHVNDSTLIVSVEGFDVATFEAHRDGTVDVSIVDRYYEHTEDDTTFDGSDRFEPIYSFLPVLTLPFQGVK